MPHINLTNSFIEEVRTEKSQEEFYDSGFQGGGSFGLRVSKSGRKAFFLIYRLHNKRKRLTLGLYPVLSLEDARVLSLQRLQAVTAGRDPAAEAKRARQYGNFRELSARFLERCEEAQLAESTRREYRRIIEREINPRWGDRVISDLDVRDVRRMLGELTIERGVPVMANRCRSVMKQIFSFAQELGLSDSNPVESVARELEDVERAPALSLDDLRTLWRQFSADNSVQSAVFQTLLLSGQRPRDVYSLKWSDIRLDVWEISHKSKSHRCILPDALLPSFHRLRSEFPDSDYVFPSSTGGPMRYLRRACKRYSCSQSWSPSDFRRSIRLLLPELGIRPDVVDSLLGVGSLANMSDLPGSYDYLSDIRQAQERWCAKIIGTSPRPDPTSPDKTRPDKKSRKRKKPTPEKSKGMAQVIPLFRDLE